MYLTMLTFHLSLAMFGFQFIPRKAELHLTFYRWIERKLRNLIDETPPSYLFSTQWSLEEPLLEDETPILFSTS
jgi:hypothetical protein